ncbi:MAG: hypothetical protein ACLTGQ_10720 [Mediterraneibacter gnavus]
MGDFVCGEADIKDENEDGCEEMESEGGGFENEDCSDCRTSVLRVQENVCMRAKIKDTSYQALNLVIHLPMETKFAC